MINFAEIEPNKCVEIDTRFCANVSVNNMYGVFRSFTEIINIIKAAISENELTTNAVTQINTIITLSNYPFVKDNFIDEYLKPAWQLIKPGCKDEKLKDCLKRFIVMNRKVRGK